MHFEGMPIVSDQVDKTELATILRELRRVLANGITGDVVELGCYEGTTSLFLQRELLEYEKRLWVYDSFEGLPDKTNHDASPAGYGFTAGALKASKNQLIMHFRKQHLPLPRIKKGWFKDLQASDMPNAICFAFLDGDFYDSIRDSFAQIHERLSPGATVLVDDYQNELLPGAQKATDEYAKQHGLNVIVEASLAIIRYN